MEFQVFTGHWYSVSAQVLVGGCRAVSVRRSQGCSEQDTAVPASSNQSTTGHSWAPQPNGGALGKASLKKGRKCHTQAGGEEKKSEEQQCKHQGQKKEGKRHSKRWRRYSPAAHGDDHTTAGIHTAVHGGPHARGDIHSLWKTPCWRKFILKDCSPWGGHLLKPGENVRRKEQQRGPVTDRL